VGKAQEVEGLRLALPSSRTIARSMPAEFDQPGLVGVKVQGECRQPVAQFNQKPLSIRAVLERDDRVIGLAHHDHSTPRMASPPLPDPEIVDVVEIDVCQQR
jgi:hypothetical protein